MDSSAGPGTGSDDSLYFAGSGIEWTRAAFYGRVLRTMREPALCSDSGVQRVRVLWFPSFEPAVAIRVERRGGAISLVAKEVRGIDSDQRATLSRDTALTLSLPEWQELERLLDASEFWNMARDEPGAPGLTPLDGTTWLFEGAFPDRYHLVERHPPGIDARAAALVQAGHYLLRISGFAPADGVID